jgi:hypothetical protein
MLEKIVPPVGAGGEGSSSSESTHFIARTADEVERSPSGELSFQTWATIIIASLARIPGRQPLLWLRDRWPRIDSREVLLAELSSVSRGLYRPFNARRLAAQIWQRYEYARREVGEQS